jgi:hypothetical protein
LFFQEQIDQSPVIYFETDKMYGVGENIDPEDYNDHTVYMADLNLKRKIGLP